MSSLPPPPPPWNPPSPAAAPPFAGFTPAAANAATFAFSGGAAGYVGATIVGWVVTAVTLGICAPYAFVLVERWQANGTTINGSQLSFSGSATHLFGLWIKWVLLTFVTLGIYSFWVAPRLVKWRVEHRTFANDPGPGRFQFHGTVASFWLTALLAAAIWIFTLGICAPFSFVLMERWKADNTTLDGRRLRFTGTAVGLFGHWIKWLVLIIITLGIYSFWVVPRLTKWRVENQTFV